MHRGMAGCGRLARALLVAGSLAWATAAFASSDAIYLRSGDDGSLVLSNSPGDGRYTLLIGEPPPASPPLAAADARAVRPFAAKARFDPLVEQAARATGVDSALLHAVISVESGYDPAAVSPKGASGLMQLMPQTAARYGVANRLDAAQSLHGGARYLRDLVALFDSDLTLVLAAYNAGENAVSRYGRRVPPYAETMAYVPRVLAYYQHYRARP